MRFSGEPPRAGPPPLCANHGSPRNAYVGPTNGRGRLAPWRKMPSPRSPAAIFAGMAGRRPLTHEEERNLLTVVRGLNPRDRALVTTQWFTGFRISEVLSLTVGSVLRNGKLVPKIGVAPRNLKGGYGRTRWVPVLPELGRALESYLAHLRRRFVLTPDLPLFLSRQDNPDGTARAINRESARTVIRGAFAKAGIEDDGRLGTHSLRKTFAKNVYAHSGRDLMILRAALGHSSVAVSQKYLEVDEDEVMRAIAKCDFTRRRKKHPANARIGVAPAEAAVAASAPSLAA